MAWFAQGGVGIALEVKCMVKESKTIVRQIDRKRAMFFGLLILLIMLIVSSVSGYLSLTLQRDEENRLTRTIGTILSESVNRISFSGKYHTRLLLEELQKKLPEIAYISVETIDGIVEANTDSAKNNTAIDQAEKALNRQVLEKGTALLRERTIQNNPVKEVLLPYRTVLETTHKGIIRIGIKVGETRSKQRKNLLFHILMIIILTVTSVWIMVIISRYFSRRLTLSERNDSHPHRKGSILHSWDRNDNSFAPLRKNFRDIVPGINVS